LKVLMRHVEDGRVEIDNIAAERALRRVAAGRGQYLFMGPDAGGDRAAAISYRTLKLNGLDPQAHRRILRELLARIDGQAIPSTRSTSCCRAATA
jgi:transposase